MVLACMLASVQGCADLIVDIRVTRCGLIPEYLEEGKIHLVGPVRIRGVHFGLDVGSIVEQDIEHL